VQVPYGEDRAALQPPIRDSRFAIRRLSCSRMTNWVRVCAQSELLPGEYRVAWDGDVPIAVFNVDGEIYAIEDVCTHDGGELTGGELHGYEIECPRHGARFDVRTGAARCPPAYEPTAVFPVRIEDGAIYTRDDRWD
jgi:3-phenylpropionate/trans-cinnamate dioxygenase ferredoxin component